jgi:hypothetical protein
MPSHQYDVHRRVLAIQKIVLQRFLNARVLRSVQNIELHAEEGEEVLKMPEIFDSLTQAIWSELPAADQDVGEAIDISSIRRNLQREHVGKLAQLILGSRRTALLSLSVSYVDSYDPRPPADARAMARLHLRKINNRVNRVLRDEDVKVTDTVRAHLEELRDQIGKVLDASLEATAP